MRADLGAVAVGVVVAAVIRHGAFDPLDAVLVPAILLVVCLFSRCGIERRWRLPLALLTALGAWWMLSAFGWGRPAGALPLFGSFAGFAAAAVLVSNLSPSQATRVQTLIVSCAAVYAVAGLFGVALRAYPMAMQAQGLWRLSGTLTYSNAAGLFLAMALPVALAARKDDSAWTAIAVTLVSGALIATMSRGALLAMLLVAPFLLTLIRRSLWQLLLGAGIGAVTIATATSDALQPVVLMALVAACCAAPLRVRAPVALATAALAAGIVLAVPVSRAGLAEAADRRLSVAQLDDRTPEWRGAAREFARAPLIGTGPERPFLSAHPDRTELAQHAHSEPLQVAMSAGLIGLGLLVAVAFAVYRVVGSGGAIAARAGLGVFVIGGIADFSWHLPVLGIIGGALAALASTEGGTT